MIISKTPYRISLFGGGTDYQNYFKEHGGLVVGAAINHYSYLTCRFEKSFHNYKSHISYSKIEQVNDNKKIKHRAIRNVLEYLEIEDGVSITHLGDLPARSGLGSSSTFIVGLLNALSALRGKLLTKRELVDQSIFIERVMMDELGGMQDNVWAAFGGINQIEFKAGSETIVVHPITVNKDFIKELSQSIFLLYTGISRVGSAVAQSYAKELTSSVLRVNSRLKDIAKQGISSINSMDIKELGRLLDENWQEKKSLAEGISNKAIDDLYSKITYNGLSAKLLGSGGGGFMLVLGDKKRVASLKEEFIKEKKVCVNIEFDFGGSSIIYHG